MNRYKYNNGYIRPMIKVITLRKGDVLILNTEGEKWLDANNNNTSIVPLELILMGFSSPHNFWVTSMGNYDEAHIRKYYEQIDESHIRKYYEQI